MSVSITASSVGLHHAIGRPSRRKPAVAVTGRCLAGSITAAGKRSCTSSRHPTSSCSSAAGESSCCVNLALLYRDGTGVDKDLARAIELARRACSLGETSACE